MDEELSVSEIVVIFLKSIVALNACRKKTVLPDISSVSLHLSGQLNWSNSLLKSDSISSSDLLLSGTIKVRIACGRNHVAYVTSNKELYTWGKEWCGRLGDDDESTCHPFRVENLHNHGIQVISVACGDFHTVALCEEGVYSWGSNEYGQLGIGDTRARSRPVLITHISSKQIVSVVCGSYHTLAITSDCKVYSWGWGVHGQLGLRSVENQLIPKQIDLLDTHKVVQAAAGYAHSVVLTSQRYVYTFGTDIYGQLGVGSHCKQVIPQLVESLSMDSVYLVTCGPFETIAISEDQTIFCWGRNYHQFHICAKAESSKYGRKMASNAVDLNHRYYPEPLQFKLQHPITQIFCGNWHYIVLTSVNQVYTWGYNDCGQLGHYNKIDQPAPRLVKALSRRSIMGVAVGAEYSVAFDVDDKVMAWGRNDGGTIGVDNESTPLLTPRQSVFSILAPTLVQGLPVLDDKISLNSTKSLMKEYIFDEHHNLPDFSSVGIGKRHVLYTEEAVLLSLHKLWNLYSATSVERFVLRTKQWFILSFCHELQQRWDKVYIFREKALRLFYTNEDGVLDRASYAEQIKFVVLDLVKKFEDFIAENFEEDTSLIAMVSCMRKIFDCWLELNLSVNVLEDILRNHADVLCPLYAIVIFGYLHTLQPTSQTLRFALYQVRKKHPFADKFSSEFYTELLTKIVNHMAAGTNWYSFLSTQSLEFNNELVKMKLEPPVTSDDNATSIEHMLKDTISHKRKVLSIKPLLILSNAVTATLAAAAKTHLTDNKLVSLPLAFRNTLHSQLIFHETNCDVAVFTCLHNLPRYYMTETVLPEFQTRMASLPNPLSYTATLMTHLYDEKGIKIPMACPYCVYNNFRNEQLQILKEEGIEINTSTWEI